MLISISPSSPLLHSPFLSFPHLSSPLLSSVFLEPSLSLSGRMRIAEFHLNPQIWELWAPARGAADTPLPHPEQLLNLHNRIISAKVAAFFRSQEHGKQTASTGGGVGGVGGGVMRTVHQFDADISNCADRFSDEFLLWAHRFCSAPSVPPDVLTIQGPLGGGGGALTILFFFFK